MTLPVYTMPANTNRVAVFSRGDCERAARSFCSQLNGYREIKRELTDRGNVYFVFYNKRDN